MFCSKCGSKIPDAAKFCSKCGQKLLCTEKSSDNDQFFLTVNRAKQWFAINPAIDILVDKKQEYKIENGKTLTLPISPGQHSIVFSFSICNKVVDIDIASDITLNIKWNRVTGSLEVN